MNTIMQALIRILGEYSTITLGIYVYRNPRGQPWDIVEKTFVEI